MEEEKGGELDGTYTACEELSCCDERRVVCQKEEEATTLRVREMVFAEERERRFEERTLGQKRGSDASGSFLSKHSRLTRLSKATPHSAFSRALVGCYC